ncbi:hypothetical protein SAMN05880558_11333 [Aeromonas sp. RU39B]|uniref:hypothetical protein n=1 Tax=Aeromonas sp. RU39B TaxID=1907416 RepID=UPI000956FCF4|nr:hypothetical protein [Aeromonas sp. RU39B]SIR40221.1 hypothetical protein SAMN05880558_11333 [Aeromonas sp. RU39B]
MFDFGSIGSSILDFADKAASTVLGGLSTAGSWAQSNPGAASLLGSALVAGGSYMENRETLKEQKKQKQDEWDRQDTLYNAPITATPAEFKVSTGLTGNSDMIGNGVLAGNGLLATMKKNQGVV